MPHESPKLSYHFVPPVSLPPIEGQLCPVMWYYMNDVNKMLFYAVNFCEKSILRDHKKLFILVIFNIKYVFIFTNDI